MPHFNKVKSVYRTLCPSAWLKLKALRMKRWKYSLPYITASNKAVLLISTRSLFKIHLLKLHTSCLTLYLLSFFTLTVISSSRNFPASLLAKNSNKKEAVRNTFPDMLRPEALTICFTGFQMFYFVYEHDMVTNSARTYTLYKLTAGELEAVVKKK